MGPNRGVLMGLGVVAAIIFLAIVALAIYLLNPGFYERIGLISPASPTPPEAVPSPTAAVPADTPSAGPTDTVPVPTAVTSAARTRPGTPSAPRTAAAPM